MKDLIAKRYVKALIEGRELKEISEISEKLETISSAFTSEKFKSIVTSPQISEKDKTSFVMSLVGDSSLALNNFVKLLGEKRRLDLIPFISEDLKIQISKMNNSYVGYIYTNKELSSDYVLKIEEQFSKKFNVKLSLSQNICDYDGIKVDIDGLGVEISFSKDRLRTQLIDHILKAV